MNKLTPPAVVKDTAFPQAIVTGLLAAAVGYGSSVPVVLQGLTAVGASVSQTASALLALGFAMSVPAILLSLRTRIPISIVWSTPGAALLATSGAVAGGFPAAVGAFIACGLLIVLSGFWGRLGKAVSSIPGTLANAMLAGILFNLCLAPFIALSEAPLMALPVVLTWAVVGRFQRLYAVPAALLCAIVVMALGQDMPPLPMQKLLPVAEWVTPTFTWEAMLNIALPLFIVTMASQNIPGLAVLKSFGFGPSPGPLFVWSGATSVVTAPLGAPTTNLAAITAALCAGPEAHPRPERRYIAAVAAGGGYLALGLFSGATAAFFAVAPTLIIQAVAGLALLGAFTGAVSRALAESDDRTAAAVTFFVTVSGLTVAGIGSAFWGLAAGLAFQALYRFGSRPRMPEPDQRMQEP
jgi:benzoate membrane transport protein